MRLAAMMMQKNESELLPCWLAYYSYLCGSWDSLFIFDDDSTRSDVVELLGLAQAKGASVYRNQGAWTLEDKGPLFSRLLQKLGTYYEWYFPVDCDEFVCLDGEHGPSLSKAEIEREVGRSEYGGRQYLRIDSAFFNIPHSTSGYRWGTKKLVVRGTDGPVAMDSGLHLYDYEHDRDSVDPNRIAECRLAHIHFHNKPYAEMITCAKEKLKNRVPDFRRETIAAYTGGGFHLKWLFETTKSDYLATFETKQRVDIGRAFAERRIRVPFQAPPKEISADEIRALQDTVNPWAVR